ncbi:MAG TPA: DNA-processing protein DprA [Anaerolineales bacterium]|nr:DNA-processing protein DprA [Anaerolineales bacterium]
MTLIDPRMYWVGFNMVKGIGAVRFKALLEAFGSAEAAWNASPQALQDAGLSPKIVETFQRVHRGVSLEQVAERIQNLSIQVLTWEDETYPRHLKEIDQPPPVLYVRGSLKPEDDWAVAIVGTRKVTAYGRQVAEEMASTLAQNGVTIISGLARGVDSIAHQAALAAGGRTLAVLGNGVDLVYPPENRKLAAQIMEQGALVSDYAIGTQPDGQNFPPRNRIISGLSLAAIIVEAGDSSGALITATFAAEQGRDVFAVPGNINAPQSRGTNRLIRDGAQPLLSPQDVLEALNLTMVTEHQAARVTLPSDPVEARLYKLLSQQPKHVDEIRAEASLPIETVSATLAMMELKGMVRQVGGMNYVAVREAPASYEA